MEICLIGVTKGKSDVEILFKDMWHHQIWGQFAGYAAGYASSSVVMPASVYILKLCLL